MDKKLGWTKPDIVVALCALFVATLALAVSVYEGIEMRRHNRLSVLPAFEFSLVLHKEAELVGIFLHNNGLDPGKICKLNAIVEGTSYPIQSYEEWKVVLAKLGIDASWTIFRTLDDDSMINEQEKLSLLVAKLKNLDVARKKKFISAMKSIEIQVEYKSLYNEIQTASYDF